MSRADAMAERTDPDSAAVAGSCDYEADLLEVEALQAVGFYPTPIPEPPF